MPHSPPERSTTHSALHNDHVQLDALFAELVNAAEANVDLRTLGEIWTRFGVALRSHLTLEEELVFPALEVHHAAEIMELRAVHDDIRARLDTIGVAVDLHFVRARQVVELVELVRAHAITEDAGLYLWAETEIHASDHPSLLQRLLKQWRFTAEGTPQ